MNQYLSVAETAVVVDLITSIDPRVVVEFGVQLGKTARAILAATPSIETYIGIDLPTGLRPRLDCQRSEVPVRAGQFAAVDPRFKLLLRESTSLEAIDLEPIDAAFIDGDHSAAAVLHDSSLARTLLRPGGIIVWHDYGNPVVEVTGALDCLAADGWPICHVRETWLAFIRG